MAGNVSYTVTLQSLSAPSTHSSGMVFLKHFHKQLSPCAALSECFCSSTLSVIAFSILPVYCTTYIFFVQSFFSEIFSEFSTSLLLPVPHRPGFSHSFPVRPQFQQDLLTGALIHRPSQTPDGPVTGIRQS